MCLIVVFRTLARKAGEPAALVTAGVMQQARVVTVDADLVIGAARVGQAFGLPLADSIIYATARSHDAQLWTHDEHFRGLPSVCFVERPPTPPD